MLINDTKRLETLAEIIRYIDYDFGLELFSSKSSYYDIGKCSVCGTFKLRDSYNFRRNKATKHGFEYNCKHCETIRDRERSAQKKRNEYLKSDEEKGFDINLTMSEAQIKELISKPCIYCGDTHAIGADRIDNTKGHSLDNCVPACHECNLTRGDRYTHEGFLNLIAPAIRSYKQLNKNNSNGDN